MEILSVNFILFIRHNQKKSNTDPLARVDSSEVVVVRYCSELQFSSSQ
jgi:hypothetical protein